MAHLPAERYRPLALDLLGHGDQADVPPPITFERCVASVLERSPERFVLGGYSMGGRMALHVALRRRNVSSDWYWSQPPPVSKTTRSRRAA